jgi:Icc protein
MRLMQVIQVTDPHLYGAPGATLRGVDTDASLRAVLGDAFAAVPDYAALLVTGDLVQDDADGYVRFRDILAGSKQPVLCVPGNHDIPAAMTRQLAGPPFQLCGALDVGAWRFVMLDSHEPGRVGGRLRPEELERLDALLGTSVLHTLVCLHHHPVAMGSRWLDGIGLGNADDFWRVIDAHRSVRGVVWGHVHQAYEGLRGHVPLFATPSTGAQFLPASDRYALDERPPAYREFRLQADGRIDSQVRWLGRFDARRTAEL